MTRRDDLRRIERSVTGIARISFGRSAARNRSERSGVDLSRPAMAILAALRISGPVRLSALALATHLEAPLVSREVRVLEAAGYVERTADPGDGRAAIVAATELGQAAFERYRAATDEIIAETFVDWPDGDLDALAEQLERLETCFRAFPPSAARRQAEQRPTDRPASNG